MFNVPIVYISGAPARSGCSCAGSRARMSLSLGESIAIGEHGVARRFQGPGDPAGPGTVRLVEADEEITLVVRSIGHADRLCERRIGLSPKAPYHRRYST